MPDRFGLVVLAAGAGRRMGGPKALMPVWDQTWWRVQRKRLSAVDLMQVWAVNEHVEEDMFHDPDAPGRRVLVEASEPMFASVRAGLRDLKEKSLRGVFVLPVDVPAPSPAVWDALLGSPRCAAPVYENQKGHPVYLPSEWIESVAHPALDDPDARLDRLIGDALDLIEVTDPDVTWNLNTPDNLSRWLNG